MTTAHVIGTGGYQPGDPIPTSTIERLVGPLPPAVLNGLSIRQRYWMIDPDTGEHRENNSDLAYQATIRALGSAGVEPAEVDLIVLATATPDYPLPPLANQLQERLGIRECATLEIRSGGAGVVQGLDIARMYLERGVYRTAVVVGSEAISPALAPVFVGRDPNKIRIRDRIPAYMFGDGAGAMVLRAQDGPGGVIGAAMSAIGGDRKPGIQSMVGGTYAPIRQQLDSAGPAVLKVDVVGAGDFTPVMVTRAIEATLAGGEVDVESIDHCLVPEGSVGWMLDSLRVAGLDTQAWQALDGKIIDSLSTMGAVGCAAVPLFLDDAVRSGRITAGDRIMLIGVEATKWIYAGAIIDWTAT